MVDNKTRKGKHQNDDGFFTTETDRRLDIERQAIRLSVGRMRGWRIALALFATAALLSPVICMRQYTAMTQIVDIINDRMADTDTDTPGKQAALEAVASWLDSSAPFRSGTANLWWDSATKADGQTGGDAGSYWSHRLTFTDLSDGSTREVTQLVLVDGAVSTPVGSPTILPKAVTGSSSGATYTPDGYTRIDQSASLTNAVESWAKAYVGKDRNAFGVLVGDPNPDHAYQPAMVGRYAGSSVNWLVECDEHGGQVDKDHSQDDPDYGCASVTITFTPYQPATTQDDATPSTGGASMDVTVLVSQPTKGSARIVDWGANGLTATLSPYANAIDKTLLNGTGSDNDDEDAGGDDTATADDTTADGTPADAAQPDPTNADGTDHQEGTRQ